MANSDPLVPFGIAICVIVGLFIVVPFLRGKTDILTGWNTLLVSLITFTGLGSIQVHYVSGFSYPELDWFQPSAQEVQWYMWASASFIVALLGTYYFFTPAKRFAQRRLRNWPPVDLPVTATILAACFFFVVTSFALAGVTFIGPALAKLGHKAAVFACVFSFMLWNRNRLNLSWLFLFFGVLGVSMLYCMLVSPGRRLIMSLFLGPVLCIYWTHVRSWKPSKVLMAAAITAILMLCVSAVYSKFRWYNLAAGERRSVSGLVAQLKEVRNRGNLLSTLLNARLGYFAQENGNFALLTERYVAQGTLVAVPLNTFRFVATYPIPRKLWSHKPEVLAVTITHDAAHLPGTTWGVGLAGHGVYEGGIPALILYGMFFACFMRLLDEPLLLQPSNPFLISIHAAALPHVLGIARGDIGVLIIEIGECILFAVLLGLACRSIFGTQRLPSPTMASLPWQRNSRPAYPYSQ